MGELVTKMQVLRGLRAQLAEAQVTYNAVASTASAAEIYEAGAKIRELKKFLSDAIVQGADPCPFCGQLPMGMEQPKSKSGVEYEIGCTTCTGAFRHTDGTARECRVRGGLLPRHAVEAWNEGPDAWLVCKHEGRLKALEEKEAAL